jgi:putative RNA 2'-phosphotransferase
MADAVRISKTLSYWLRHRPDAAGLMLDKGGWAPFELVVQALAKQLPGTEGADLIKAVRTNDKQRFELSEDGAGIRARQGHSVKVSADWPVATPPAALFHGTVERYLPTILLEGLKPMRRHHVHLSPDRTTAERVGSRRGQPVVLIVDASGLAREGGVFRLASNGVWLVDQVPPRFLSRD